jgi:hypothetical protein
MDFLKQLLGYALLVALFWGTVVVVKKMSRVQVPSGYSDVAGLAEYTSYRVDETVTLRQYRAGDPVCYRLGNDADRAVTFAWIAGLPGDEIAIAHNVVTVNGKPAGHGSDVQRPDAGPLRVPANHVYVLSDSHQLDSVAYGPIPAVGLRGRLGSLP